MAENTNGQTHTAIPEIAPDTRVLAGRLSRLEAGEMTSYEDLSNLIGRNVQGSARSNLNSARRIAERDYGIALAAVRGQGIKRLEANHISDIGDHAITHLRRTSKRASRRMLNAAKDVGPELSVAIHARASVLGAIALCANENKTKQIEQKIKTEDDGQQLPAGRVLDLFKG